MSDSDMYGRTDASQEIVFHPPTFRHSSLDEALGCEACQERSKAARLSPSDKDSA